ncbi:MAG: response regulator, partial [Anaerolineae bacterium]|nr:response regulator [Anaerolineae bacterium]
MKILVVDDEPDVIKVIAMSFRMQQPAWEVISAEDGPEALDLLDQERPDVVLLDIGLP